MRNTGPGCFPPHFYERAHLWNLFLVGLSGHFLTRQKWVALFCSGFFLPVSKVHFTSLKLYVGESLLRCTWGWSRKFTSSVSSGWAKLRTLFCSGITRFVHTRCVIPGICLWIILSSFSNVLVTRAPVDNLPRWVSGDKPQVKGLKSRSCVAAQLSEVSFSRVLIFKTIYSMYVVVLEMVTQNSSVKTGLS